MSVSNYRNKIDQLNAQIAILIQKQNSERKKEVDLNFTINELCKKAFSSRNLSKAQSYQSQIDHKSKELMLISNKVEDYEKELTDKRKELFRNQNSLSKAMKKEAKNGQRQELSFLYEQGKINTSELNNVHDLNAITQRQQIIFQDYQVLEKDLLVDDIEYSLKELTELHERINTVLEKLEKLGYSHDIFFDEIEQLKSKSKKISKKDLKMMLMGVITSFGIGKIGTTLAAQIFQEITSINSIKLVE